MVYIPLHDCRLQRAEPPAREVGPLELTDEDARKGFGAMLKEMMLSDACKCHGIEYDSAPGNVKRSRRQLLRGVADELLGEDWEFEELC